MSPGIYHPPEPDEHDQDEELSIEDLEWSTLTSPGGPQDYEGEVYGLFPGGDPRRFTPDPDGCTPEEIEAHRLACIEWDEGRGIDRGPSCLLFGDGSAWNGTGFGIGTYTYGEPSP